MILGNRFLSLNNNCVKDILKICFTKDNLSRKVCLLRENEEKHLTVTTLKSKYLYSKIINKVKPLIDYRDSVPYHLESFYDKNDDTIYCLPASFFKNTLYYYKYIFTEIPHMLTTKSRMNKPLPMGISDYYPNKIVEEMFAYLLIKQHCGINDEVLVSHCLTNINTYFKSMKIKMDRPELLKLLKKSVDFYNYFIYNRIE